MRRRSQSLLDALAAARELLRTASFNLFYEHNRGRRLGEAQSVNTSRLFLLETAGIALVKARLAARTGSKSRAPFPQSPQVTADGRAVTLKRTNLDVMALAASGRSRPRRSQLTNGRIV